MTKLLSALLAVTCVGLGFFINQQTSAANPARTVASKLDASARSCGFHPGNSDDATPALAACIDATPDGGTLALAPGIYTLKSALKIRKQLTITTAELAEKDPACLENTDHRCAELRAASSVSGIDRGIVFVDAASVTLSHLVFDGNKHARQNSGEAARCRGGDNGYGMNLHVSGKNFHFLSSSSLNALCGSGLEVGKGSDGLMIVSSLIARSGIHNLQSLWSDGVTIADVSGAEISNNQINDNTDVDLIFGGCQNCRIHDNHILHTNSFASSSFAALMLHSWPGGTSGDYTDTVIENNTIDCGAFRCGAGLLIGASPWYKAPTFGGLYRQNHVIGAQSGIALNDATGPVMIGDNTVEKSGGIFLTSAGKKSQRAYSYSKASQKFVQWQEGADRSAWDTQDLTGAIPNWWTSDSTGGVSPPNDPPSAGPVPTCQDLGSPDAPEQFVLRLYCRLLDRDPDAGGFADWVTRIRSGVSRQTTIVELIFSNESKQKFHVDTISNPDFVKYVYDRLLGRPADASGLATWTGQLQSGKSRTDVINLFLSNPEPRQTFGLP